MKFLLKILIGIIAIVIAVLLVVQGNPPEFFDIFGLIVFIFLFIIGILMIHGKKLPDWTGFVILLIAILGLIVDGSIIIKKFILGG
ncbi:MAG: hypothetical protein ABIJ14_02745 [Nanoarchaeota archaeon]|nr:hypothetical protein [Nanoarchaeota archaeon]